MSNQSIQTEFGGERRRSFMRSLLRDLRALEHMLKSGMIEEGVTRIGAEQEMFLVDRAGHAAPAVMAVLEKLKSPSYTTELGQFQLECNLDPLPLRGDCFSRMEKQLAKLLAAVRAAGEPLGVDCVLTGILPSLRKSDLGIENMVPNPRYHALNQAMTALRGSDYEIYIKGVDELRLKHDSVMVEACNSSFQVHYQVGASNFARLYNLAQALAGPVLAAATNSPLLLGRRLWAETRIALFQQAVDTRSPHQAREVSPRVTFGDRWVRESVIEIFREDIARFRTLVGVESEEDSVALLRKGAMPELRSLRLHNGTVYRWTRACYGMTDGKPHLRIENRVLPSGPSVVDELANGAFWIGLMVELAKQIEDVTKVFEFEAAKSNLVSAARQGLGASLHWIDGEEIAAQRLILDRLLPAAHAGLRSAGVNDPDRERLLGIIDRRVSSGRTGSRWILYSLAAMKDHGTQSERLTALTNATIARQRSGQAVDSWEPARRQEAGGWKHNYLRVEQYMTTDLYTVHEDDPVELAAHLMEWHRIRHVPVEDHEHRLVGLVSYRAILRLLGHGDATHEIAAVADTGAGSVPAAAPAASHESLARPMATVPVSEIMRRDPVTIAPNTLTIRAIEIMRSYRVGCLPVIQQGRLVGIVTEHDFTAIAGELLEQKLGE